MTQQCITINVQTPANIVLTAITPVVTTCPETCSTTVNITWRNTGETAGNFIPAIVVDGITTSLASEPLAGLTNVTHGFTVTGLTAATSPHTICATPNPTSLACATITVRTQANITIQSIMVGSTTCLTGCNVTCATTCPTTVNIVVTWANSGGSSGTFTPTVAINGGTAIPGSQITVAASPGTGTTTFTGVVLPQGAPSVCFNTGTITSTTP
jgi:hypothetical protein